MHCRHVTVIIRRLQRGSDPEPELRRHGNHPRERERRRVHLRPPAAATRLPQQEDGQPGQPAHQAHHGNLAIYADHQYHHALICTMQVNGKDQNGLQVGYFRARIRKDNFKLEIDVERMVEQNW